MLEKAEQLNSAVEEALVEDETLAANVAQVVPEGTKERFIPMQLLKEWDRSRLGYRFVKRAFDIVFSGCVIVVGLVPALVLCAVICAESPGNPIYVQTRVGRTHRDGSMHEFKMFKFRSMVKDADEKLDSLLDQNEVQGAMFKMKNDPRITRVGKFIRKHSIDEFPQFINVFLGDMTVVGPRPPLPREVARYTEHDLQRLAVKPGVTGLWQVTERNNVGFDDMVELDLAYIKNSGPLYDLKLVAMTVTVMLKGEGAS